MPPSSVRRALFFATGVVCGLGLAVEVVHGFSHADAVEAAVAFLSLSHEANLPTWYASSLLCACAVALVLVARRAPERRAHWWALAALFLLFSLDETAELHENLYVLADGAGIFYFSWVIPAAVFVALFGAFYLPFVQDLPPATRRRFVVAGALYVGGALLMELPLGLWTERHGADNLGYALIDFIEESLELAGASLFLVAILRHRAEEMS